MYEYIYYTKLKNIKIITNFFQKCEKKSTIETIKNSNLFHTFTKKFTIVILVDFEVHDHYITKLKE